MLNTDSTTKPTTARRPTRQSPIRQKLAELLLRFIAVPHDSRVPGIITLDEPDRSDMRSVLDCTDAQLYSLINYLVNEGKVQLEIVTSKVHPSHTSLHAPWNGPLSWIVMRVIDPVALSEAAPYLEPLTLLTPEDDTDDNTE